MNRERVIAKNSARRFLIKKSTRGDVPSSNHSDGDKSNRVLVGTVGGAVIGNLIVPGFGGAFVGALIGAVLGNGSTEKESDKGAGSE